MKNIYNQMLKLINCRTFREVSEYFAGLEIRMAIISNISRTGIIPGHMLDFMNKSGVDTHLLAHGKQPQPVGDHFTAKAPLADAASRREKAADSRQFCS